MREKKFQKKLEVNPNPEYGGLNEYELSFMTTPESGPYQVDDMLLEGLDLNFFSKKFIKKTIKQFQKKIIPKIGIPKYEAIEASIAAYTLSATKKTDNLFILKKSVLNANETLTNVLGKGEKLLYLEKHNKNLEAFDLSTAGYTIEDLNLYRKDAENIMDKALKKFVEHLQKRYPYDCPVSSIEDLSIYRGFNSLHYYRKRKEQISDFLSLYAAPSHNEPYFEPNILNSYSLCSVVAEKFMVAGQSQRRVFITSTYEILQSRILSSFLISPVFVKNQFEILALPQSKTLSIKQDMNEEQLYASFTIL